MRVTLSGLDRVLEIQPNETLSRLFQREGVLFPLPCGGRGRCGKCALWVRGAAQPPEAAEIRLLGTLADQAPPEAGYVLRMACLTRVRGDCHVRFPHRAAVNAESTQQVALPPNDGAGEDGMGFAADLGTTTVVLRLYDLARGTLLHTEGAENRQGAFGADVISRIAWAGEHGQEALRRCVTNQLGDMMRMALRRTDTAPERVVRVVVTGNTTMLHFLTGLSAQGIGVAPFTPESLFGQEQPARGLWPWMPEEAMLYLPRCVSAYVGADITCGMVACGLTEGGTRLLLDVGTNGEMALYHQGVLRCCAAAAGPAFEGAEISRGMMAAAGAIDHVAWEAGQLRCRVIGGGPARGICGTGLVSALSALRKGGQLDETGALSAGGEYPLGDSGISLTAADIRKIQLAKAAIAAGMDVMLMEAGITPEEVEVCEIAGGFGTALDPREAADIGLIPAALADKTRGAGNLALAGASGLLFSGALRLQSEALAARALDLPLATHPAFSGRFMEQMLFPELDPYES